MRTIFAVLTLAFLLVSPTTPKNRIASGQGDHSPIDNRGTKDAPLIVDVNKPSVTKEDADKAQAKEDLDTSTKRWTVALTGVIALSSLVQILIYGRQTSIANRSLVASVRPKLLVRSVTIQQGTMVPVDGVPSKPWHIHYTITNNGGSRAKIQKMCFWGDL